MIKTVIVSVGSEFMEFEMEVNSNENEDEIYAHIVDYVLCNINIEVLE